ncbi:MAG: lysophospholipid acyltransferase family protein [Candidatus Magnetomorum sp.]|nr:lysophospholipid acyltransferase family protein [Candidatus Magnetomorum sp.]
MKYEQLTDSNLRKNLKWRLVGISGKWFIDALFSTIRMSVHGWDQVAPLMNSKRFLFVFWHSRILPVCYTHKGYNAAIMVSRSEDGEIIAQVIYRQGHEPVRGSSTRGGREALHYIVEALKSGNRPGVIIPDGPVGPRYKVQHGIIRLAQITGYPIISVTGSFSHMAVLNSWDRFIIPRPFSRGLLMYGHPIYVPADADKDLQESLRHQLESEMNRITHRVDAYFGHDIR